MKRHDLPVVEPDDPPRCGDKLVGYQIYDTPQSILICPRVERLSCVGWMSSTLLCFTFPVLFFLPCIMSSCQSGYQVPVYE